METNTFGGNDWVTVSTVRIMRGSSWICCFFCPIQRNKFIDQIFLLGPMSRCSAGQPLSGNVESRNLGACGFFPLMTSRLSEGLFESRAANNGGPPIIRITEPTKVFLPTRYESYPSGWSHPNRLVIYVFVSTAPLPLLRFA